jgi:hypothetical protein
MYSATIFDEAGLDQGSLDISAARNDVDVRDVAAKAGRAWLVENGQHKATIKIVCGGFGFPIIEVDVST